MAFGALSMIRSLVAFELEPRRRPQRFVLRRFIPIDVRSLPIINVVDPI
jgi:hypothetical protein